MTFTAWENYRRARPSMARFSDEADRISYLISSQPLGWLAFEDGNTRPAFDAHDQHGYDSGCAICKAGAAPAALRVVIDAVLKAARSGTSVEGREEGQGG